MTLITIPHYVLAEAEAVFVANGLDGFETTAMLRADRSGAVNAIVIPDQIAGASPLCWVEVTHQGKLELATALGQDEVYVARIHSHPGAAFHSYTDDRNPALNYPGALSIVVPNFGRDLSTGIDKCAIYRRSNQRWVELPPGPSRDTYIIFHD
jgi:proteasome lid subunit RPN8/RPN11